MVVVVSLLGILLYCFLCGFVVGLLRCVVLLVVCRCCVVVDLNLKCVFKMPYSARRHCGTTEYCIGVGGWWRVEVGG